MRRATRTTLSACAVAGLALGVAGVARPGPAAAAPAPVRSVLARNLHAWPAAVASLGGVPRAPRAASPVTGPPVSDPYAVHAASDGLHWTDLITRATGVFAQTAGDLVGEPVTSRDGTHVAYAYVDGFNGGSTYTDGIAVFDVRSTATRTVLTTNAYNGSDTSGTAQVIDADPAFDPTGATVYFDRELDVNPGGTAPTSTVGVESIAADGSQATASDGPRNASNPSLDGAGSLDFLDQSALTGASSDCLVRTGFTSSTCLITVAQAAAQLPGSPDPGGVGAYDLRAAPVGTGVAVSLDYLNGTTNETIVGMVSAGSSGPVLTTYPATLLDGNAYAEGQLDVDPSGTQLSVDRVRFDAGGAVVASSLDSLDLATGSHLAPFAGPAPYGASTHLLAPAAPTGSAYTPLAVPVRVLDTRTGTGTGSVARIGPGGSVDVPVTGSGHPVPTGATAVVLNLTGIIPTAGTYLQVYPTPADPTAARPLVSNLNLRPGQTAANAVTVALPASGTIRVTNNLGTVDVAADVVGYYTAGTGGASLLTQEPAPVRVLDTRYGTGGVGTPLGQGGHLDLPLAGTAGISPDATAVVISLGGIAHGVGTFLTAYPTPAQPTTAAPGTSTLNLAAHETRENLATVALGAGGAIRVYNAVGSTDVFADVVGFYRPAAAGGDLFVPLAPTRVFDTRNGTNSSYLVPGPVGPHGSAPAVVRGRLVTDGGTTLVDPHAVAVSLNVTAVAPTAVTFLSLSATPPSGTPTFSALDAAPGQTVAAGVITSLAGTGEASIYNSAGSTAVVLDLAGYFLPVG